MAAPPDSELEIFTYEEFGVGVRWLAEQLVARDWIPDVILVSSAAGCSCRRRWRTRSTSRTCGT